MRPNTITERNLGSLMHDALEVGVTTFHRPIQATLNLKLPAPLDGGVPLLRLNARRCTSEAGKTGPAEYSELNTRHVLRVAS